MLLGKKKAAPERGAASKYKQVVDQTQALASVTAAKFPSLTRASTGASGY